MANTSRVTVPGAEELLGKYFPVLDHGFVALVDYMGSDDSIVQAARVSYGAGTKQSSEDRGLTRYLTRHRHTTPSEMVELKFHMKLPIFVARQLIRHRTASVNEYSGRYSLMPLQFYTPDDEQMCSQSKTNKQGRAAKVDEAQIDVIKAQWDQVRGNAKAAYSAGLHYDLAREIARIDLPLSMYTEWYWKMDLHNLFHFLSLRCDDHSQWETRQFANVIAGMVQRVAPDAYEAWIDYKYCARTFSRQELNALADLIEYEEECGDLTVKQRARLAGLSAREAKEFEDKIFGAPDVPDFSLDLSKAKSSEYFHEQAQAAVPVIEEDK